MSKIYASLTKLICQRLCFRRNKIQYKRSEEGIMKSNITGHFANIRCCMCMTSFLDYCVVRIYSPKICLPL